MRDIIFRLERKGPWSYYTVPELTAAGIRNGFCTGDIPSDFRNDGTRQKFLDAFGCDDFIVMDQKHSDVVNVIANGERPSWGDALIFGEKNIMGIIRTADCLPVILADPGISVAAVIHAGWRGTVQKITAKTLEKMMTLGAKPEKVIALLGPAIGPCCYEVQDDVTGAFHEEGFSDRVFRREDGRVTLNLKTANRELLVGLGVRVIYDLNLCTLCTGNLFHSFRRGDRNARQINFVSIIS